MRISHLSESIEREKKCFNKELEQMNREPEHSVSRIRAEVSITKCGFSFYREDMHISLTEQSTILHQRRSQPRHNYTSICCLQQLAALQPQQLGHGDFSAANTKVLTMFNTLAVDNEAKQSIKALRTELQRTKEKLQAVEESKSQAIYHEQ